MAHVNAILNQRIKRSEQPSSKMAAMAKQSATGNLTSFAGIFSVIELSEKEKNSLETILKAYAQGGEDVDKDLNALVSITSEVKAINNQAAILHGERIKKAHQILTPYREGAFTAWLIAAYGNRQTPYNFMQYYDFHESLPRHLRMQLELIPRQAIYVLASRSGELEKKQKIVENYQGETKEELLTLIRQTFPLHKEDKRGQKVGHKIIQGLDRIYEQLKESFQSLSIKEKKDIQQFMQKIQELID